MNAEETMPSRPLTPESPLTNSLYRATNTIDDLTLALANFSRFPSPEPPLTINCCCGAELCENVQAWHELRTKLENKLALSAEVGQALLQRHEAYVRQHEHEHRSRIKQTRESSTVDVEEEDDDTTKVFEQEQLDALYADVLREKDDLEKRLNQALVNTEVTEVSNKTLLQELHDARATISRLTAHHARSIGWDSRLTAALKERDDMQQERDSESHRARLAESRFVALKDKTIKLQTEVRRLQDVLEEKRSHRLESSGTLLQDAKSRLDNLREAGTLNTMDCYEGVSTVLETLVQDNETLKADNDELQRLLGDSREDYAALQEEFEEYRANPPVPRSGMNTPHSRHFSRSSVSSVATRDYPIFSTERKPRRTLDPLLFDNSLSPTATDVTSLPDGRWPSVIKRSPLSPSHYNFEIEGPLDEEDTLEEKRRSHRPLLLLSKSRGVQTEDYPRSTLTPSPMPSLAPSLSSPIDIDQSEASSFSESSASQMNSLIDRALSLLIRMTQADPLTLTNRLKRQHLLGADVNHLSKSTITNIINEVGSLRQQYRSLLEEDKAALPVTRKDLRLLFRFLKDAFTEMGQMRSTLNDVILDPSTAPRISQQALHPAGDGLQANNAVNESGQGWMAPLSRLFSPPRVERLQPPTVSRVTGARIGNHRFVPKSGPALAASATTVNVEFSGTGGRLTTSTTAARSISVQQSPPEGATSGLKDIFVGAPVLSNNSSTSTDNWVVVRPEPRRMPSIMSLGFAALTGDHQSTTSLPSADINRTIGRSSKPPLQKSDIPRNVDAVIDDRGEANDAVPPLLRRTLRRRGLSDSSIHSTFSNHVHSKVRGDIVNVNADSREDRKMTPREGKLKSSWPDGTFVFQALSRTVHNLTMGVGASGAFGSGSEPHHADKRSSGVVESSASVSDHAHTAPKSTPAPPSATINAQQQTQIQTHPDIVNVAHSPSSLQPTSAAVNTPNTPKKNTNAKSATISPRRGRMSDFSSWAAAGLMLDPVHGVGDAYLARNVVGSFRDESFLRGTHRHEDEM